MRSFDVGKLRMSILFVSSFRGVTCVESPAYMLDYKVESGWYFTQKSYFTVNENYSPDEHDLKE